MAEGILRIPQDRRRDSEHDHSAVPSGSVISSNALLPAAGLPAPTLLVIAALAAAVAGQGAYYRTGQRVVVVLIGAAAVVALPGSSFSTFARRRPVRWCAALAGCAVLSASLAGNVAPALSTVLVLAGAAIVVLTCERLDEQQRDQVAVAVVALGVLVALSGWAGVAWHRAPWALEDQGLWRAATTITYANAAAGFLAVVALLSLARASNSQSSVWGTGASCLLLTGLGATLSRGGLLSFSAGALLLIRVLGVSIMLRTLAAPALGALVALAGLWPSIPAPSPARPGLAAGALVVGLVVAVGAARVELQPLLALAAAGLLAAAVVASGPAKDATRKIAGVRLSVVSPDRVEEARAALRLAAERPLTGVGPEGARLSWVRPDGTVLVARYAHNEYLQTLAELGVLGLCVLLSLLAAIGRTVQRCRPTGALRPLKAGVAAGLVALAVHGFFDFGWHVPAIALTGALLVGVVTTSEREDQQ